MLDGMMIEEQAEADSASEILMRKNSVEKRTDDGRRRASFKWGQAAQKVSAKRIFGNLFNLGSKGKGSKESEGDVLSAGAVDGFDVEVDEDDDDVFDEEDNYANDLIRMHQSYKNGGADGSASDDEDATECADTLDSDDSDKTSSLEDYTFSSTDRED